MVGGRKDSDSWFSTSDEGTPLRWHYPIGLLHDLYFSHRDGKDMDQIWRLTVHFSPAPSSPDLLLFRSIDGEDNCAMTDTLSSLYFATVKQADFLRNGTGKRINNLSRSDQMQFWESVWNGDRERFWKGNAGVVQLEPSDNCATKRLP